MRIHCFMNSASDHHVLFVYLHGATRISYVELRTSCVGTGGARSLPLCAKVQPDGEAGMASFQVIASLLTAGLFSCFCFLEGGEAAQCMPDRINPCIAECNGTSFDLSKAFDFPYVREYVCVFNSHSCPYSLQSVEYHCFPMFLLYFAECSCLSRCLALGKCMAICGVLVNQFLVNQALIQTQIVL